MIQISGLNDSIFEAMLAHTQDQVVHAILNAASNGQTSCLVLKKGLTQNFLSALELEGVNNLDVEDNKIKLFWEW